MPIIQAYIPVDPKKPGGKTARVALNDNFPLQSFSLRSGAEMQVSDVPALDTEGTEAYSHWREALAACAGIQPTVFRLANLEFTSRAVTAANYPGCPFGLLLSFSPCEGAINWVACDYLISDFKRYEERARAKLSFEHFGWYRALYHLIKEVQAKRGVLQFRDTDNQSPAPEPFTAGRSPLFA